MLQLKLGSDDPIMPQTPADGDVYCGHTVVDCLIVLIRTAQIPCGSSDVTWAPSVSTFLHCIEVTKVVQHRQKAMIPDIGASVIRTGLWGLLYSNSRYETASDHVLLLLIFLTLTLNQFRFDQPNRRNPKPSTLHVQQ